MAAQQIDVGNPEKGHDESKAREERVTEGQGDDGGSGGEPGGGVASGHLESIVVGKFKSEAREPNDGEESDAQSNVQRTRARCDLVHLLQGLAIFGR